MQAETPLHLTPETWPGARPLRVNGYLIVKAKPTPGRGATRPGHVILVDTGAISRGPRATPRFITAWLGEDDPQWCWGHQFNDHAEALADYAMRCQRGY